jgi:hypothetical protein
MTLAADFQAARTAFLDHATAAGGVLETFDHPERGPDGERLAADVARFGDPDAPQRLVCISGTHGVEGFAGSMCQTGWLREGIDPRPGLAVILVHAINPYGFAWVRRVNEDNVDLNRNCVDFAARLPDNPGYDELADLVVPPTWDDATQEATTAALLDYAGRHGLDALQAAVSIGQYRHDRGLFFGGREPVWSRTTLRRIVTTTLRGATGAAVIDLHTGLGEFGEAELIAGHPDAAARARLAAYFDDFTVPADGNSVSADVRGDILDGISDWLPELPVAGVAIEWGTVDIVEVLQALRADAWLHGYGDPLGSAARPIKEALRAAFAPDAPQWADRVLDRFEVVRDRAIDGLLDGV